MSYKNIIFDLHGVLFDKDLQSFKVIDLGCNILKELSLKDKHNFYVCTNWDDSVINTLNREFYPIMNIFKAIINPNIAGARKPDKKIFNYLLDNYNLLPEESLFIDDQEKNIDSASDLGIKSINIKDFDRIKKLLN